MHWWIVDNLVFVWAFLTPVVLAFVAFWWTSRNAKLLIGAAVPAAIMLAATLLSLFVVTDRKQLVRNVESMRDLVNAGKFDQAIQHFDEEVKVDTAQGLFTFKKSELGDLTKGNMRRYGVKEVVANNIQVTEVSRRRGDALVTFYVGPADGGERGFCKMGFALGQDGKWRVKTFTVEMVLTGQKTPLLFPF